jgi:hypothetical protein
MVNLMKWPRLIYRIRYSLAAAAFATLVNQESAQTPNSARPALLNQEQIIDRMQKHDQAQMETLGGYQSVRHYSLEYRGFFKTLAAKMDAEISYDASSGKSFRILSESGSHTLCEKVLRRAIDSEKEASLNRAQSALTEANYRFHFVGTESVNGRSAYVLEVDPIMPSKFLYRGRIWVDAIDFAVARMEVQPGKNPSFWISKTIIHHTNEETDGFWLPHKNQSETKVRIGGTAVLTIDYGSYQTVPRVVISQLR